LSLSPVIESISLESRPATVCTRCPVAVWHLTRQEGSTTPETPIVQAYCRVMYRDVWGPEKQNKLTDCDELRLQYTLAEAEKKKVKDKYERAAKKEVKSLEKKERRLEAPSATSTTKAEVSPSQADKPASR